MKWLYLILFTSLHVYGTATQCIDAINTYFKNPIFLNYDPTTLGQVNINHYEFDAVKELEITDRIMQILRTHSIFKGCDRMFVLWISTILKNAKSEEQAINTWRNVGNKHGHLSTELTPFQIQIINLPAEDIKNLYKRAQESISQGEPELTQELLVRVLKRHQWHDKHQTNAIPLRSLAIMKTRKINIKLLKDCIELVRKLDNEDQQTPIYELIKNFKVFHINDFYASKGSLITHDIFDHFWFASKLEEAGIFHRYRKFWRSLGSPQLYDIFSREGELFASIAFDFRAFQVVEKNNYVPLFKIEDIKKILQDSIANNASSSNQKKALELLMNANNDSIFVKGLAYIVSGMAIELLESNRKSGYIKTLDERLCPSGYFNFFDPEHIAFIVESVHFLFQHRDQHIQLLTNLALLIEKYLTEIAIKNDVSNLIIGLEDLEVLNNIDLSIIPQERIQWIKNNIGFEAMRYSIH
jgi:hypothetical protein